MSKELNLLLHSMGFLRRYLTEAERETLLDNNLKTIHKHNRPFIRKLQALKYKNRVFPSDEEIRDKIWVLCVDGVHFMTFERRHPDFSRDTEKYDNKSNGCGLTYEIGTHIYQDRIIWMNEPFKYGSRGNFM